MNGLYKKSAVLGIVLLLLVISIVPTTGKIANNDKNITSDKQLDLSKNLLFDRYINSLMKLCLVPSLSACTINGDEVLWSKGYGYLDPDVEKKETTSDTIFLVMSISKPVTATALMQLYEQGLFDLDEDVNNYLPFSLRNPNHPDVPITFRMLLSHQSSLAYDEEGYMLECLQKTLYIGDPDNPLYPDPWLENYLCPGGKLYHPEIWADEEPGSNFHYANVGFGLIGFLIEIISGQEFNEYCIDHIFTPLDMMNTSFYYRDLNTSNIAIPYAKKLKQIIPPIHLQRIQRQPLYSYLWAACTDLKTSANDLSHFLIAHMNGGVYNSVRILNESTVEMMHTIQYPGETGEDFCYGLGWMIFEDKNGNKMYGHDGGGPGVRTRMLVRSSDNVAFIYFTTTTTWQLFALNLLIEKSFFWNIDRCK